MIHAWFIHQDFWFKNSIAKTPTQKHRRNDERSALAQRWMPRTARNSISVNLISFFQLNAIWRTLKRQVREPKSFDRHKRCIAFSLFSLDVVRFGSLREKNPKQSQWLKHTDRCIDAPAIHRLKTKSKMNFVGWNCENYFYVFLCRV